MNKKIKNIISLFLYAMFIVVLIGTLIYFKPFQESILPDTNADVIKISSTANLLKNGKMDTFCVYNPTTQKAVTDDGTNTICRVDWSKGYDHEVTNAVKAHPYDWDLLYGTGVYKYTGTDEAYIGTKMAVLDKTTTGDWYGFGNQGIPAQSGKVYETYIYAKRTKAVTGDEDSGNRDCGFDIYFANSAGQTLDKIRTEAVSGSLGVGNGNWGKVYARAIAPVGTATAGFQIWCSQNGKYQYYIDGQYMGVTKICNTGETRACGDFTIGSCHQGTQSCDTNGVWAECKNYVNPISEICGNNIDDNCNGVADSAEPLCEKVELPVVEQPNYLPYIIIGAVVVLLLVGLYIIFIKR